MDILVPSGTNPQQVIEQHTGKYEDPADKLPEGDRFPNLPAVPSPNPFSGGKSGGTPGQ